MPSYCFGNLKRKRRDEEEGLSAPPFYKYTPGMRSKHFVLYTYLRCSTQGKQTHTHTYGRYSDINDIATQTHTQQHFTYIFNIVVIVEILWKSHLYSRYINQFTFNWKPRNKYQTYKYQTCEVYFRKYTLKNTKLVGILYAWTKKNGTPISLDHAPINAGAKR